MRMTRCVLYFLRVRKIVASFCAHCVVRFFVPNCVHFLPCNHSSHCCDGCMCMMYTIIHGSLGIIGLYGPLAQPEVARGSPRAAGPRAAPRDQGLRERARQTEKAQATMYDCVSDIHPRKGPYGTQHTRKVYSTRAFYSFMRSKIKRQQQQSPISSTCSLWRLWW